MDARRDHTRRAFLGPALSMTEVNQGDVFRSMNTELVVNKDSASANKPDVRLQVSDTATVGASVRESVRVSESR
jgi:hypothetical protein